MTTFFAGEYEREMTEADVSAFADDRISKTLAATYAVEVALIDEETTAVAAEFLKGHIDKYPDYGHDLLERFRVFDELSEEEKAVLLTEEHLTVYIANKAVLIDAINEALPPNPAPALPQ